VSSEFCVCEREVREGWWIIFEVDAACVVIIGFGGGGGGMDRASFSFSEGEGDFESCGGGGSFPGGGERGIDGACVGGVDIVVSESEEERMYL
jgi:hypothetical protein